jgi:hypothetical protein
MAANETPRAIAIPLIRPPVQFSEQDFYYSSEEVDNTIGLPWKGQRQSIRVKLPPGSAYNPQRDNLNAGAQSTAPVEEDTPRVDPPPASGGHEEVNPQSSPRNFFPQANTTFDNGRR